MGRGSPFTEALRAGRDEGRDFLVTTQGAWSCQRGVRVGDHLYLRTWHDGYHDWPEEMLFDLAADPHEQHDLAPHEPVLLARTSALLDEWLRAQLPHARDGVDPLAVVMTEGGPYHVRGHLPAYLDRLRATGRSQWANHFAAR